MVDEAMADDGLKHRERTGGEDGEIQEPSKEGAYSDEKHVQSEGDDIRPSARLDRP